MVTLVMPVTAAWSPMMLVSVLAPVLVPARVRVRGPVSAALVPIPLMPLKPRAPVPVKLIVSVAVVPEALRVAPPSPMLKRRLVLWAPLPANFRVPLSMTRAVANVEATPMLLLEPPSERSAMTRVLPLPIPVARA